MVNALKNKLRLSWSYLKSKRGSSIFEWVVVIAVVAIIAVIVSPKVKTGIEKRADTTIQRVNDLETLMSAPK